MKKIILSVIIFVVFATFSRAQSFHLGVKLGANLTKVDGKSFQQGFDIGYQLGGFAELDLNKTIGIQPEVLFSQTNTKMDSGFSAIYKDIANPFTNGKVKLNYLSIPVLLRINANKLITFQVGPQFSILVSDNENLLQNGKDAFKKGDFAMVGGVQLNLGALRIYGRYNIGLSDINDIDDQDKWKNQQLQLGIGWRIL